MDAQGRQDRGETRDQYVIGVDFGTLSGRAVVVRVRDGAELGTAVHDYAHAVMDATLAGDRRGAAARSGRCRCPTTTSRCCAAPFPRPSPPPGSTPPSSSASPPTSPHRPRCPSSPTAPRSASSPVSTTARTPT